MITQPAKVIATCADYCLVETIPKSACPRCAEGKGCGRGILAQAFAYKTYQLQVPSASEPSEPSKAQPEIGEHVLVAMNSNGLLLASVVMYLLPLLSMIMAAVLTALWFSNEDIYTVLAAVLGLGFGAVLASRLSKSLIKSGITAPLLVELERSNCWYPAD